MPGRESDHSYARFMRAQPGPRSLAFYGLGQTGMLVRGPGGTLAIDPYLSDSDGAGGVKERNYPPPVEPERVSGLSAVLVTHEHLDHFDPVTLRGLRSGSPEAVFVGPHTCDFGLADVPAGSALHPAAFEELELGGAGVTPVPSAHETLEVSEEGHPYFGYVIEWNGVTLYHAGDTVIYGADEGSGTPALLDTLRSRSVGVLIAPINGRDWFRGARGLQGNTDASEVVEMAEELDVSLVIPTHYDMIPGNTVNPAHFVDILYRTNHARPHHLLRPGEVFVHQG